MLEALEARWVSAVSSVYSEYHVLCVGTFVVNLAIWITTNLPYVVIDHFGLLRRYKIQPNERVDRRAMWTQFLRSTLIHSLTLPLCLYAYPLFQWAHFSVGSFPCARAALGQFVFFNVLEDFLFYWIHRALHANAWLYRHIHSVHHIAKAPYSVAGAQAHPLELLFGFMMPTVLPPFVAGALLWTGPDADTRVHALAFWGWLWYRELRATEAHSGYVLPWHLSHVMQYVGYTGARAHDKHHSLVRWNFGSFNWWDKICGTSLPEHMYHDTHDAHDHHHTADGAAAKQH